MEVLIAEDDPVGRRLLEAFLCEWGYDVQAVSNGREAWEAIQEPEAPSLVISDWMMSGMTGAELCKKIRAMNRADSFGTVSFIPESKEDLETLIKRTDDALYRAKGEGRNRVCTIDNK